MPPPGAGRLARRGRSGVPLGPSDQAVDRMTVDGLAGLIRAAARDGYLGPDGGASRSSGCAL